MEVKELLKKIPKWRDLTPTWKGILVFIFLVGFFTLLLAFCGEANAEALNFS